MYNPDQHYAAHTIYLKELSEQAEQRRMIAALSQGRPARIRVSGWRLGVLLVRLRTWLSRSASSRPNVGWRVSRKPDGRGKIVALASSACGNTGGACDAEGNQSCAYCTQA
jgi:hypothetical protein